MGLLSDPSLTPKRNLVNKFSKHSGKISFLFYITGIIWYLCLALPAFQHNTYLSENALSPGLVYAESKVDSSILAQNLLDELNREREKHEAGLPYSWISAKMKQIGLETYVHNFSLTFPISGKEYKGKNVYGILRAAGTGSTEGIVFSVPYRPPSSINTAITPSVPVLLAFAEFARRKNYWAKDLIFLVTDQELLGTEAWLKAYYEENFEANYVLHAGYLPARSGLLQAAINLEIQDLDFEVVNVKLEGLNGQLPNLDLFNLVQRIMSREGVSSGYKQLVKKKRRGHHVSYKDNLLHMSKMLTSQASGVPTGSHGLFNRYRVEALTLEAIKNSATTSNKQTTNSSTLSLLKIIEGISRSLNNLLERFHQSFFFYILVQNDKFVSIGDYIPSLCFIIAPNFIKALLIWLSENGSDEIPNSDKKMSNVHKKVSHKIVMQCISMSFICGVLANILYISSSFRQYLSTLNCPSESSVSFFLLSVLLVGLSLPYFVALNVNEKLLLHASALILLGVSLIVVGLLNYALGMLLGIVTSPLSFIIQPESKNTFKKYFSKCFMFLTNPLLVAYFIILYATILHFPESNLIEVFKKTLNALVYSISYALADNIIYGNWLFTAVTIAFFPQWVVHWIVVNAKST